MQIKSWGAGPCGALAAPWEAQRNSNRATPKISCGSGEKPHPAHRPPELGPCPSPACMESALRTRKHGRVSQLPWGHSRQGGGEDTEGCPGPHQAGGCGQFPAPVRKAVATGTAGLQGCSCRRKDKDHEPAGSLLKAAAPSMTPPLWAYQLQVGDSTPTAGLKPRPCHCWR